jgi:hypothetical protein
LFFYTIDVSAKSRIVRPEIHDLTYRLIFCGTSTDGPVKSHQDFTRQARKAQAVAAGRTVKQFARLIMRSSLGVKIVASRSHG